MRNVRGKLGIRWLGYVIMPEHVHLLLLPQAGEELVPISTVLNHLKGWSGRLGKESLRSVWREKQSLGAPPLDAWATGPEPKPFWKTRGYDFNVLKEDTFLEKLDYMHKNPVRRNLVDGAADWRWSSYRFYECGDASLIDMDSLPG